MCNAPCMGRRFLCQFSRGCVLRLSALSESGERIIERSIEELFNTLSITFVDYFLQPLVMSLPSLLGTGVSANDSINSSEISEDECFLVTMDIESLYTNVPSEGGLQAAEYFLNQHSECTLHSMHCRPY